MLSLVKLFKKILKINIKYKKVGYPKGYPADEPIRRCPDISKSKKHLNFNPSVDLKSGIIRVLKAKLIIK
jgi:UDP-glucuronate decarboxylase